MNVSEAITCVTVLLNIVTIYLARTLVTVTMVVLEINIADVLISMSVTIVTIGVSMGAVLILAQDIVANVMTSELKFSIRLWVIFKSFAPA